MRILITGIAGFIGSNLANRLLQEGHDVIGIDNLAYGLRENVPPGATLHQQDIRDRDVYPLFHGIDVVFHFAAKNCIADCQCDPVDTADINVRGTVNVFEAAKRAQVKKIVYAESSALYEGCRQYPTPESDEAPESFYAVSKMSSKFFADAYHRYFGITSTALRYFCVYGPVQDYRRTIPPVMSAFIIKLLKGEAPVIYGTGEKRRDFVYVDDINDFHVRCLTDKRTNDKVFNLGSGMNHSVNDIYSMITDMLDIPIPPVRQADLPGEAEMTLADITAARNVGWAPKTSMRMGLENAIAYIKSEMHKGRI
jgi:nucleoside-diphosphate-sugar epimerase